MAPSQIRSRLVRGAPCGPQRTAGPSGSWIGGLGAAILLAALASCALPGKLYLVAPEIRGRILEDPGGTGADVASSQLELVVLHRESMSLHSRQRVQPDAQGRFEFEATRLEVAGHEYSKYYRFYLHLQDPEDTRKDRVIWRTQRPRTARSGAIELACDLTRPQRLGEVCQVVDPLEQDWLIAEGGRTYQRLCESCHGPGGRPLEATTSDMQPPPADLTRIAERREGRFDKAEVAALVENGANPKEHHGSDMPVWGERLSSVFQHYAEGDELVGATLDPLVVYLESIQVD